MRTIKCSTCGKYVHIGASFGQNCTYCGSFIEVESGEIECHIESLSNECEKKIASSDFLDAIAAYDSAIEMFPNQSQLYWGRLLARHSSKSDCELVKKGVLLKDDGDYILALHFADDIEKECLLHLSDTREKIASDIVSALTASEISNKIATGIIDKQKDIEARISELRDDLKSAIMNLDEAERKIRNASVDCDVIIASEKKRIDEYVSKIEKIKNEFHSKTEVALEIKTSCIKETDAYLAVCNNEWNAIQSQSNAIAFEKLKDARAEQDRCTAETNRICRHLSRIKDELGHIIATAAAIATKYELAKSGIENGSFEEAGQILGDNEFMSVLHAYMRAAR